MLQNGNGVITAGQDAESKELFVRVNRSKITAYGNPALAQMLCRIQIWRSAVDINAFHLFYEALSYVWGLVFLLVVRHLLGTR